MSKVLCITPVIVIMYKLLHHPFQSHLSDFILLFIHSHLNFQVLPPQQSIISKLQCNHLTLLFVSILIPIKHLLNLLNPFQVLLKLTITSKWWNFKFNSIRKVIILPSQATFFVSLVILIRLQFSFYDNISLYLMILPLLGLQIVSLYYLYKGIYLINNSHHFFLNLIMRSLHLFQTDSPRNFISFFSHCISISHNSHTNLNNNVF
jgi:hypothetical protein